jgi:hypothetical protein
MSVRRVVVVLSAFTLALTGVPVAAPYTNGYSVPSAAAEDDPGAPVFVNEIHYANSGVDSGEFVELAGPAGTDLTGVQVVLYDGATGTAYDGSRLTETIGVNGVAVVDFPVEGIQDGPDAVALVDGATVTEFLSWGGDVMAADGPAAGLTSTDIGLVESDETSPESSLQVTGTGDTSGEFAWTGPKAGSRGAPNEGQTLTAAAADDSVVPGLVTDEFEPGEVLDTTVAPSDPAIELVIEGESLVPSATGTPVIDQASSGQLSWSNDRQLRVNAVEPFDETTVTFQVPQGGAYQMASDMTFGANFGVAAIAVDGVQVAEFDGSGTRNLLRRRFPLGTHDLSAGDHTLTFTAVRPGSGGLYRIGMDLLRLRLQPDDGRLLLTPWTRDTLAGKVPVYGWSTDLADTLSLEVDHRDVMDWEAIADTATLVYEARGIEAGPGGADFADGISVRGHKTILDYDVFGPNAATFVLAGFQIPGELLHPGPNTFSFFAGQDPALPPGANLDDFDVRNLQLVLPDGTVIKDPARPDGTIYPLGDNNPGAVPERTWTLAIPPAAAAGPAYRPARGYILDTQQLADGPHIVTLTAEGPAGKQILQSHISVDNQAPVVRNLSPADGSTVKGRFTLGATVTDAMGRRPVVVATLDGTEVKLGTTLTTDDLIDGPHVFSVTATDAAGSTASATSTFTTVGETPDAPVLQGPADGATGVPADARLSVRASDPAQEPLQVTFFQATPSGPPLLGRAGTATGEVPSPASGGGTPLDPQAVAGSDDVYADSAATSDEPYQRYDVQVTRFKNAKYVDLSWEGRVASDRQVVLSVWNKLTQRWTQVAASLGDDDADTTLIGRTPLLPALDRDVVHLLVQAQDTFAEIPSVADRTFENPDDYDFSVAWITDTQYLAQGGASGVPLFGDTFTAMTQWVKDNAAQRKIVYSAHTGDVINNWQATNTDAALARREFDFASARMKVLDDNGIPNGVTPGNHDNKTGPDSALFNEFFPPSRYDAAEDIAPTGDDGEGYYGGPWQPADNQNHYDLVEAGGQKLLFLYLGYLVKPDEIAWANQVLADHRDRKAVVLTHSYLLPSMAADGRGGELTQVDGVDVFNQVVLPNENVFLALSGHTHGVGLNIKRDVGTKGRAVVEMLANHQFFEVQGERRVGHLRLLQFDLDGGRVSVNTYSPYLNDFNANEFDTQPGRSYLESADEFVVPVDLAGRATQLRTDTVGVAVRSYTVIGSVSVPSGDVAELTWRGLTAGTKYGWYARATDALGNAAETATFTFTTAVPPAP